MKEKETAMSEEKMIDRLKNAAKTVGLTLLVFCAAATAFFRSFYAINRSKECAWKEEKECFRELTLIMEQSSREKKEWIATTIQAEKTALGRGALLPGA